MRSRKGQDREQEHVERSSGNNQRKAAARPAGLAARLRSSPAESVETLIAEHRDVIGLPEARAVARNPFARAETLEALASIPSLMAVYEARALVARHRRTPQVVAMRFIGGLFWHDLNDIALDVLLPSPLRHLAEKYLLQRLPRLAVGERITLARRAPAETLAKLCLDVDLRVLDAALDNPRLTEERLLPILQNPKTSPQRLQKVATHPRWACCYEVRLALCRNPLSPLRTTLALLPALRRGDLAALAANENVPSLLRFEAGECLQNPAYGLESPPELSDLETPARP